MADLSPKSLFQEWKGGAFRPAYLFCGEDAGSKQAAVETLRELLRADAFNSHDFPGSLDAQAAEIASACATPPMFSARRVVIVRNAEFAAAGRRILADYLRSPLETTTLVLLSGEAKADPKDAIAMGVAALGGVVLFKALAEGEAVARLRDEARRGGFELEAAAAELLVSEAGGNWGILRAELEKLRLFVAGKQKAGVEDAAACLGYRKEANPFELARMVQRRKAPEALALLRRMLEEDEKPFALLAKITGALSQQLRAKRLAKSGVPPDQIFRELRVNKYYNADFLKLAAETGEASLIRGLRACLDAETALKSSSWLEPKIELESLVLKVCGKDA